MRIWCGVVVSCPCDGGEELHQERPIKKIIGHLVGPWWLCMVYHIKTKNSVIKWYINILTNIWFKKFNIYIYVNTLWWREGRERYKLKIAMSNQAVEHKGSFVYLFDSLSSCHFYFLNLLLNLKAASLLASATT